MNKILTGFFVCLVVLLQQSCRTAKAKYTPDPSVRNNQVSVTGSNQCRISGDRVMIEFPNQAGCSGNIWDFQRSKCASHLAETSCDSYAEIRSYISQISSTSTAIDEAAGKAAKILACGTRDTTQYKDYTVQLVYPPDQKSNFTQQTCELGVNFRVETICYRVCKTQACQAGIVTGSKADQLVYDCLQP